MMVTIALINRSRFQGAAVAKAYSWDDYTPEMSGSEILQRLLKLNLDRASQYGQQK